MPTSRTFGSAVQARRKELDVSQALVAWVARVSRNTVSNIERDEVKEPDERVITNVSAALGMPSWINLVDEDERPSLVPEGVVRRLMQIIERMRLESEREARAASDAYVDFMKAWATAIDDDDARLSARQFLAEETARLVPFFLPRLRRDNPEDERLFDFFEDQGWSPADTSRVYTTFPTGETEPIPGLADLQSSPVRKTYRASNIAAEFSLLEKELRSLHQRLKMAEDMRRQADVRLDEALRVQAQMADTIAPALFVRRDEANAFARLPVRVQEALLAGQVIDSDIVTPPNTEDISLITMVVRKENLPAPLTADGRRTLINALRVWHLSLVAAAGMFKFMQKNSWMAPEMVEERINEALSVIVESSKTGLDTPPENSDDPSE